MSDRRAPRLSVDHHDRLGGPRAASRETDRRGLGGQLGVRRGRELSADVKGDLGVIRGRDLTDAVLEAEQEPRE